jgi:hypothetical protein
MMKQTILDDYFPVAKKDDCRRQRTTICAEEEGECTTAMSKCCLSLLPDDIIKTSVLSFLTMEDLVPMRMTCHWADQLIDSHYRGDFHIVRQFISPPKLTYEGAWKRNENVYIYDWEFTNDVHQIQTFSFLVKTRFGRILQLELRVGRWLWQETAMEQVEQWTRSINGDDVSAPSWVDFRVFRRIRYNDGSHDAVLVFEVDDPQDNIRHAIFSVETMGTGRSILDDHDNDDDHNKISIVAEQALRDSMEAYIVCAKHLIASEDHSSNNLPSFEFFLSRLDARLWKYAPHGFTWEPQKVQDRPKPLAMLWKFRPPPSLKTYFNFFDVTHKDHGRYKDSHYKWRGYEIHEIPWYRPWYPKPIIIHPHNVLASLPLEDIYGPYIFPHLSNQDLYHLTVACPTVGPRLIEYFRRHFKPRRRRVKKSLVDIDDDVEDYFGYY